MIITRERKAALDVLGSDLADKGIENIDNMEDYKGLSMTEKIAVIAQAQLAIAIYMLEEADNE